MLWLLIVVVALIAWGWHTYPRIGHLLYDLNMALEARLYRLRKVAVRIDDAILSTYQGGPAEASTTLLMLHGYSADKNLWLRFARPFVADYRVIIPDLAGHGESGFTPGAGYDIPSQGRRVLQLLDACGVAQVHVIGNSMGGYIAAWLAATYPERIASLALIDPAGVASPQPSDLERQLAQGNNPFLIHSRAQFQRLYPMTMATPPWVPGAVLAAIAERYERRREELAQIFSDFRNSEPLEGKLAAIQAPTLLLWGREDRIIHVSSAQVWTDGIVPLRAVIWDRVGHMPMVEAPVRTARLYREFLEDRAR